MIRTATKRPLVAAAMASPRPIDIHISKRAPLMGWPPEAASGRRALFGCRPIVLCGVGAWRITEPMAKFAREMRVVAKAAGVSDFAKRLTCSQQLSALKKAHRVIQTM
jgi:hypothetical protein